MAASLTPEQKRKIEENRKLALQRRDEKLKQIQLGNLTAKNVLTTAKANSNKLLQPYPVKSGIHPLFKKSNPSSSTVSNGFLTRPSAARNAQKTNQSKTWNVITDEQIKGTCSLYAKDRFMVKTTKYSQEVIDICKNINGRVYLEDKRGWGFPVEEYEHFKKLVAPLSPRITIGNFPKIVLQFLSKKNIVKQDFRNVDISKIESTLLNCLFPFQKEGIQMGIAMQGKCLIADDMGLGKTLQGIGLADYYKNDWPLLIVCPSSMRYQWQQEIYRYLRSVPSYHIYVLEKRKDYIEKNAKIVIISFDLLINFKDFIKSHGFGMIIVDESHFLKSYKAMRTKSTLEIVNQCKRCILLSGTPALSRPIEIYCQLKAVNPYLFPDMIEFGIRYCDGVKDKYGWNFNGSSHLDELKTILDETIMIRREKKNVLDQLPSKIRQVITLNPDLVDSKNKTMQSFVKKLQELKEKDKNRRSTILAYFNETGRAKLKAICKYVEELLEKKQKFLLFAHHKEVLDAVCKTLESNETYYIRIDGSVGSEERKSVCDQFQEEEKFRVAVLSLKAANTGVTLTAAHQVVFAELFWNPGELLQAEDRAHRIGQKNSVVITYLLANGTADDQLWPMVQSKLGVLNEVGLSHDKEISVNNIKQQENTSQKTILNYFNEMLEDDIDDEDLTNLMDEIEGVPEKKIKLM